MSMKYALLPVFALFAMYAQAQSFINIQYKNGTVTSINVDDVQEITFTKAEKGTADNPYTVAELLVACQGLETDALLKDGAEVYARGIITKVKEMSTQYGNATYYIADSQVGYEQFTVYRGSLVNRAPVTVGDELAVGDTVVVCGQVKNYRGTTLEFIQGNYLVSLKKYNSEETLRSVLKRLEFPMRQGGDNNLIVVHTAKLNDETGEEGVNYSVEWDTNKHAQRWSCYQMYESVMARLVSRYQGGYPNDVFLPLAYHLDPDPYVRSGYDHGHILPSADRMASAQSNEQTFYMTNMQPQVHAFNAGLWEKMEDQVRTWAERFDTLYVCKGGTIDKEENIMGYLGADANMIPVPKYFFMALLGKSSTGYTAVGLWVEHRDDYPSNASVSNYVVNIRDLEQKTGLDFFHNLPDTVEEQVETLPLSNLKNVWGM